MFGMGMGEIVVILIVALLFIGPDKLPKAAKSIGKGLRQLRRQTQDLQETLEQDENLGGTLREIKSALRGEEPRPMLKPVAQARPAPPAPAPAPASPPAPAPPPTTEPGEPKKGDGSANG